MTSSRTSPRWVGALALSLLPLAALADSRLASEGQRTASAHLLFTIVIPESLSFEMTMDRSGLEPRIVFSGGGRRRLARFEDCTRAGEAMSCTVSMP